MSGSIPHASIATAVDDAEIRAAMTAAVAD
jgi:hypothetical protein